MIAVEGSLQTDNYTDQNGEKRKSVQLVASQVSFCGSKAESGTQTAAPAPDAEFEQIDDDDDLPF